MAGTIRQFFSTAGAQAFSDTVKEIGRVAVSGNPNANVAVVATLAITVVAGGAFWANKSA